MPETTARLMEALGQQDTSLGAAVYGDGAAGAAVTPLAPPLFPKLPA